MRGRLALEAEIIGRADDALAEVLRHLGIVMQPFVPDAAAMLLDQLGVPPKARRFADLADPLAPGRKLPAPRGIFPRFVEVEAASA